MNLKVETFEKGLLGHEQRDNLNKIIIFMKDLEELSSPFAWKYLARGCAKTRKPDPNRLWFGKHISQGLSSH